VEVAAPPVDDALLRRYAEVIGSRAAEARALSA
jgi:hypothetical protein